MKKYIILLFLPLLISCSKLAVVQNEPILMTLKTNTLKYSDAGFLRNGTYGDEVQLFNAGFLVLELKTKQNHICLNKICLKKRRFNEKFLSKFYYDELLEDILNKRPIFGKQNLKPLKNGFSQDILDKNKNINYIIEFKNIRFKDKKNKIFIKIKALN